MKAFLKALFEFILYSNLFIAFCAGCAAAQCFLLIELAWNWHYLFLVFFATLSLYLYPALTESNYSKQISDRHAWITAKRKLLIVIFVVSTLLAFATLLYLPFQFIFWFFPVGVLALAYFIPTTGLRKSIGLNTSTVALVWTAVTAFFPLLVGAEFNLNELLRAPHLTIVALNFFYIFPLCLVYNIRDIEVDKSAGIRTLPVIYGIKRSIFISCISLCLFFGMVLIADLPMIEKAAFILSGLLAGGAILLVSEHRKDYYYSFWIDGMILLQFGLLLLSKSLY